MAKKEIWICDRCKKEVKRLYEIGISNGLCYHPSRYEVCPKCKNEIEKFVERNKVDKDVE